VFRGTGGAPGVDNTGPAPAGAPPGEGAHCSKKTTRLPHSSSPTDDRRTVRPAPSRAALGLPEEGFVFCSFNQPRKVTPEVFDCWLRLLSEVERSVLWLSNFSEAGTSVLRGRAAARAIDPDRLIFAPWTQGRDEHLARLARADLALDCYPYGAHTTASDLLWAGVPLVGFAGSTFVSRVSASILGAAGMADFVATSLDDYHDLALRLARDPAGLAQAKQRAAASRGTPLFDPGRFTRNLEQTYREIVERQRSGLAPDHVTIAEASAAGPAVAASVIE